MSEQEQRIAIAEFCGWRLRNSSSYRPGTYYHIDKAVNAEPPDYVNNLNAMHEAESHLYGNRTEWRRYSRLLQGDRIHATAAQRAEALLRTIGKWKDTP